MRHAPVSQFPVSSFFQNAPMLRMYLLYFGREKNDARSARSFSMQGLRPTEALPVAVARETKTGRCANSQFGTWRIYAPIPPTWL
jgi:hypothetical protein